MLIGCVLGAGAILLAGAALVPSEFGWFVALAVGLISVGGVLYSAQLNAESSRRAWRRQLVMDAHHAFMDADTSFMETMSTAGSALRGKKYSRQQRLEALIRLGEAETKLAFIANKRSREAAAALVEKCGTNPPPSAKIRVYSEWAEQVDQLRKAYRTAAREEVLGL